MDSPCSDLCRRMLGKSMITSDAEPQCCPENDV
jgi:hypothetical protein